MTTDVIKCWNKTYETNSEPVIKVEDIFITEIIGEKAGIK
jgi:hypothetical protein